MAVLLVAAVGLGLIPAFIARDKGENFATWWLYGTFLFIIALPHSILLTEEGGRRFNPPPGWPAFDASKLPLDWQPDPRWGPMPEGWQLWTYEPKPKASGTQWALAVGSVAVVLLVIVAIGLYAHRATTTVTCRTDVTTQTVTCTSS